MEALRQYLKDMSYLPDVVLECLGGSMAKGLFDHNNADELRLAYKEAQQMAMEKVESREKPYYVVIYPQVKFKCPTCSLELSGAYWEISNPKTNARGMLRTRMMHEFIEHGRPGYFEPIVNMSEVHITDDEHDLDVKKLNKLLTGLPLPPDVQAEIQTALAAGKV